MIEGILTVAGLVLGVGFCAGYLWMLDQVGF